MTEYFASAPAHDFFWWCAGSGVIAAAALIGCFAFLHRTRLMENMPTSRLRSAAQGYVELEGRARLMPGAHTVGPLTKARCVWWRFSIEEKRKTGKNSSWVTVQSATSDECFEIDDNTGRCVVDPDGAKVIPSDRQRWYGSTRTPAVGPAARGGWLSAAFGRYRYTEERIAPEAALYALGGFRTQTGAPDTFDEQVDLKELLDKWKHDGKMMTMLDVNKDGRVDQKEWDAARRMAQKKVRDEHVQRAVETPDLHVLARPRDGRPYILSGVPQAQLIRRWRWSSAGCLLVACAAAFLLIQALLARGLIA